jgi:hypothetical protein
MTNRSPLQLAALAVGAVFLLVGILGFIPGITASYGDMTFVGHDSEAKLLGLFQVNVVHNIVHLLFGVVGLVAASAWGSARLFLIGGGAVYLALWLYGVVIDLNSTANFVSLNTADNWLHLGLGVGMIALGLALARTHARRRVATA